MLFNRKKPVLELFVRILTFRTSTRDFYKPLNIAFRIPSYMPKKIMINLFVVSETCSMRYTPLAFWHFICNMPYTALVNSIPI